MKLRRNGMLRFTIVWLGQAFSLLGTNISAFGVTVWTYQKTGSATAMALIILLTSLATTLVGFGGYFVPPVRHVEVDMGREASIALEEAGLASPME
jgi:hypothetical protein